MIDEDSSSGFEEVEQVEREIILPNLFMLQRTLVGKRCRDGDLYIYLTSLLYHPFLVCILFGMPFLHLFYMFLVDKSLIIIER